MAEYIPLSERCTRCGGKGSYENETYAGPELYQCHVCHGSGMVVMLALDASAGPSFGTQNAYVPWLSLGLTEVEYWKKAYFEARKELALRGEDPE